MNTNKYTPLTFVFLAVLATGCANGTSPRSESTSEIQPTATNRPVQTPTQPASPTTTSLPLPTIQTGCTDSAQFVEDVSIPDNTTLKANETFTKTWRIRNTGKCIWNVRYALVFVGGEQMGGIVTTPLSETPPGETLDISINLTAPVSEGQYTGLYELRTPQGGAIPVGSVTSIWVKVIVGKTGQVPAAKLETPDDLRFFNTSASNRSISFQK